MAISREKLRRSLQGKFGFHSEEGGRHEKFVLKVDGVKRAVTYLSRGHREIDDAILARMARSQLHLSRTSRLYEMVDCTVSKEEYLKILGVDGGHS